MSAVLMDGKAASEEVVGALQVRVGELPFTPRLTFVRVGDDPASAYYVRSKERMARRVGVASETRVLPEGTSQAELLAIVAELNSDPEVDGLLVQLPAPGVDEATVLAAIDPDKDVDGLHPLNVGRLWTGRPGLRPATPSGVIALADRYGVELEGARAVVVGRSNLVGKPLAAMLLERNATVTLAHSRTRDLAAVCRDADVLVAAVGRPGLVTADMVKPGAAVFDVGLSRVDGKVVGDVSPDVAAVAGWLTPMPGGTGLMTVAMVVANTVEAAVRRRGHAA
ncbi:MAG TPA: bifunctional 5,10-methylenetetrahydrofolate dehydrogenase/5,10-methenyltetrahydrofolate cyclohydrolase [Trueperaceae bacterium]|nr:bifunctional 5,10-methylenetetrahydrofolate dehydrogenase/5,10-methenyltetrahydrofolate cyclohydrolase [Trueperaceae bacterium]